MRQVSNGVALGQAVRRLGLLVLLVSPAAQAEPVWQTMKSLLAQGKAVEAYQQGSQAVEEQEGELNFDYYYGMAAIDAGEVSRGVFALERVLYLKPGMQSAQLELARGYFLLEQYALAKELFLQVLLATPPQNVKDKISIFLAVIEKREAGQQSRFLAYLESISGYDSNTNFAPDSALFYTPTLGEGRLDEDGVSKAGGFNDVLAGISYYRPLDTETTQFLRLDLADHNVWWTNSLDTFAYTAQMGFIKQPSSNTNINAQFLLQEYQLANEDYRSMLGLASSLSHTLSPERNIQFSFSFLEFDYAELDNRDANEYNLSAGVNQYATLLYPALWSASVQYGANSPKQDTFATRAQTEREFARIKFSQRAAIGDALAVSASLSYMETEYGGTDAIFAVTREDTLLDASLQLDWRWDVNWRVRLEAGYKEQDSNIDIYKFDRAHAQLGVRYEYY